MSPRSIARALLEHVAENGPLLLDIMFPPHPRTRFARAIMGLDRRRYRSRAAAMHSYASILNRLKREGLVARKGPKIKSQWTLTPKGHAALRRPQGAPTPSIPHAAYEALPAEDNMVRLVTFDIPEKHRAKRNWLRRELLACGYGLLHKSVFIGKRPLPEEVLAMMETLGLGAYVHIVSVDKKGTLSHSQ